jgi:hypothetical protein
VVHASAGMPELVEEEGAMKNIHPTLSQIFVFYMFSWFYFIKNKLKTCFFT